MLIYLIGNGAQEAYYDMLVKYREELTRPIQEAMDFMRRIETQLNMLCNGPVRILSGTFFFLFIEHNKRRILFPFINSHSCVLIPLFSIPFSS